MTETPQMTSTLGATSPCTTTVADELQSDVIRQACEPIGKWWQQAQLTGHPDPEQLRRSVRRARLLGPVPGPLGEALAYILDGCPDLDYPKVHAAFSRVTSAGAVGPTRADLGEEPAVPKAPLQLCLAGMPAPMCRPATRRRSRP